MPRRRLTPRRSRAESAGGLARAAPDASVLRRWRLLAAAPASAADPPADLYGDPLPAGAAAQAGSVRFRHAGPVFAAALSPDGKAVAAEGGDRVLRVWAIPSGKELLSVPASRASPSPCRIRPTGPRSSAH